MKTKAEIVQALLNEGKITAEDAVVLLMDSREKEYVYIPTYPAAPYRGWTPGQPYWYVDPFNPFATYSTSVAIANTPSEFSNYTACPVN